MAINDKKIKGKAPKNSPPPAVLDMLHAMTDSVDDYRETSSRLEELESENRKLEAEIQSAIVVRENGLTTYKRFTLMPTHLVIPEDVTQEEADDLGHALVRVESATQFWMGDWANLYIQGAQDDFERGQIYQELAERFGIERKTLQNYASVGRQLDPSRRREGLSYSHHAEVANLPLNLKHRADALLEIAVTERLSVRALRDLIGQELHALDQPTTVTQDSWLFAKDRVPRIGNQFQTMWSKARNGDKSAKKQLREMIHSYQKWLEDVDKSIDE
jgi:hypothetical protein